MDYVDPYEGLEDEDDQYVETSKPADKTAAKTVASRRKPAGREKPAAAQPTDAGDWTLALPIIGAYLIWGFWFMFHFDDMDRNALILHGFINLVFFGYTLFVDPGNVQIVCIRPDKTGKGLFASRKIMLVPLMFLLLICLRLVFS